MGTTHTDHGDELDPELGQAPRREPDDELHRSRLAGALRVHVLVYVVIIGGVFIVNFLVGGGWWSFWPSAIWGIALAVHFFITKSLLVDEGWVAERSLELRDRSYDFGHIEDIKHRVETRDPSVRPADERD